MTRKLGKDQVDYGPGTGGDRCSQCEHFLPERGACTKVFGTIEPGAWCTLFQRKGS